MQELLQSNSFYIEAKIRWLPALTTRFNIISEENNKIGEIIFHPAWMYPFLWLFGFLIELALIVGGGYFIAQGENNTRWIGIGVLLIGLSSLLFFKIRDFISSRSPSTVEITNSKGEIIITARKGWAIWRPTFTVRSYSDQRVLGRSRQSLLWGDLYYKLMDADNKTWGAIKRKPLGIQYRITHNQEQVAHFRRKIIDTRKILTGVRSYVLEFTNESLKQDERAFLLGTLAYVDVLIRQKKLRKDKKGQQIEKVKKRKENNA